MRSDLYDLVYPLADPPAGLVTARRPGKALTCPCCDQRVQVYRRRIHSTLARTAIRLYRAGGAERYVHVPSLDGDNHEVSQLAWWGLVEEELTKRPDGGRAGYWRLTTRGERFVEGEWTVQRYAHVYNARVLGFEGEYLGIREALGERFSYDELMEHAVS